LRRLSAKLVFIVFRQQTITIQGVLQSFKAQDQLESRSHCRANRVYANQMPEGEDNTGTISEQMVRSIEHYPSETIVAVHAKLRKAPKRVKNATVHDYELEVYEVHKIGDLSEHVPFTVYDAENINRDKEDIEDEDDEGSLSSLYPTTGDKAKDSPKGSPRQSTDLNQISADEVRTSQDKLTSRSECAWFFTQPKANDSLQQAWISTSKVAHCHKEFASIIESSIYAPDPRKPYSVFSLEFVTSSGRISTAKASSRSTHPSFKEAQLSLEQLFSS
jgi:hypothetical protein